MDSVNLIAAVREAIQDGDKQKALDYLDDIENAMREAGWMWPPGVMEIALDTFGASVQNIHGRTYKALDRRIRHACKVWGDRYRGLESEELWDYAGQCLVYSIRRGFKAYSQHKGVSVYPYVYKSMERVVHDDNVASGFKRRMVVDHVPSDEIVAILKGLSDPILLDDEDD